MSNYKYLYKNIQQKESNSYFTTYFKSIFQKLSFYLGGRAENSRGWWTAEEKNLNCCYAIMSSQPKRALNQRFTTLKASIYKSTQRDIYTRKNNQKQYSTYFQHCQNMWCSRHTIFPGICFILILIRFWGSMENNLHICGHKLVKRWFVLVLWFSIYYLLFQYTTTRYQYCCNKLY